MCRHIVWHNIQESVMRLNDNMKISNKMHEDSLIKKSQQCSHDSDFKQPLISTLTFKNIFKIYQSINQIILPLWVKISPS